MTEKELIAVIIDELKEFTLCQRRTSKENTEMIELCKQVKTILATYTYKEQKTVLRR